MKISVFGCGYVGLTTAVGLAEMGNQVLGIDTNAEKIRLLQRGKVPFFEPGIEEMLIRNLAKKRLRFSTDAQKGVQESDVIVCAVATPEKKKQADLTAVLQAAKTFATHTNKEKIFINKSTVPVGTSEKIRRTIERNLKKNVLFSVVSNPEFLREGTALKDFFEPDRVVFGLEQPDAALEQKLAKIFRYKRDIPFIFTNLRNAELIKYASNAFLATKISFMNELSRFCDAVDGDIREVARGMRYDPRIGQEFLDAGIGFGGSCLPKDLQVLISSGRTSGCDFPLMSAVHTVNQTQPDQVLRRLKAALKSLRGKQVAVWGLSFKPNTDDLRDAPSRRVVDQLLRQKAKVRVFDPAALKNFQVLYGTKVSYGKDAYDVLRDADALLLLTEWPEFCSPDYPKMKRLMKQRLIVDGRNVYDPRELTALGFSYYGIGRS